MGSINPIAELAVAITADLQGLTKGLSQAEGMLQKTTSGFGGIAASVGGTLVTGAAVGGAAILGLGALVGKTGLDFLTMQENATTAFTTMLGDGGKAADLMKDLQGFAASTPFEFPEIANSAKSLLAFGVGAEDMTTTLQRVGDIASGIGAPLGEIAELYGKAKVQGRLFGEDINQLTGRGIPIIKELAKQFGVSESAVKDLVAEGKVGFPNLEQAFKDLTSNGGQFAGMMDAQSKTFDGMLSTLKDGFAQLAGQAVQPFFELAKQGMAGLTELISGPAVQNGIANLVGWFTTALPDAISKFTQALETVFNILTPEILLPIAAVIGGVLVTAFTAWAISAGAAAAATLVALAPLVAVGAAVGLLAAAWLTNFGGIRTVTEDFAGWINTTFGPSVTDALSQLQTAALPALQAFGGWISGTLLPAVQGLANWLGPILGAALAGIGDFVIRQALPALTQLAVWILTKGLPAFGGFANQIGGALNAAIAGAIDLWGKLLKGFQDAARFLADVQAGLQSVASAINGTFTNALNGLLTTIQPIINALVGLRDLILEILAGISRIQMPGMPGIPGFAGGTNFAPGGLALVGERGPELVNLPRGSQVIPNNKLGATQASAQRPIIIHYSPTVSLMDEAEAMTKLGPFIRAALAGM